MRRKTFLLGGAALAGLASVSPAFPRRALASASSDSALGHPLLGHEPSDRIVARVAALIDSAILPAMREHDIPGMAVGVAIDGRHMIRMYGTGSRASGQPISERTLFEVGSVSKTYTATLAAYAEARGLLSLSDRVAAWLPALSGTAVGQATLLDLATQTGAAPFNAPAGVTTREQLFSYLRQWRPGAKPGAERVYSNVGIGLLGMIAAERMGQPFAALLDRIVLAPLGLHDTFIDMPAQRGADYAQGYTATDAAVRLRPGLLWQQAYGVRASARDLLRYVQAHIDSAGVSAEVSAGASAPDSARIDPVLARALARTHALVLRAGPIGQALVWERYPWPVPLRRLQDASAASLAHLPAQPEAGGGNPGDLLHKTGGTNGFSAYVAFLPAPRIGLVMLANKAYPPQRRIAIAHALLCGLTELAAPPVPSPRARL